MTVEALHSLSEHFSEETIQVILSAYMQNSEDTNPTAQAIRKAYGGVGACLYCRKHYSFLK